VRRGACGLLECHVLVKDCPLEVSERWPRFKPGLGRQHSPGLLVRLQRFGLPSAPVEGEHKLGAQTFPHRVASCERLELGDDVCVTSERKLRFDQLLLGAKSLILEAGDFGLEKGRLSKFRERRPPPKPERLTNQLCRAGGVPAGARLRRSRD
jgi:hypothetical protein